MRMTRHILDGGVGHREVERLRRRLHSNSSTSGSLDSCTPGLLPPGTGETAVYGPPTMTAPRRAHAWKSLVEVARRAIEN